MVPAGGAAGWASGALSPSRDPRWDKDRASRAASAAARAVRALTPLADQRPASAALAVVRAFLDEFAGPIAGDDPLAERRLRARAGILTILDALADAHRRHHDLHWTIDELSATVRRAVENETFAPARGRAGVRLLDAAAAPFGDFESLHLAGLMDGEWPACGRMVTSPLRTDTGEKSCSSAAAKSSGLNADPG